MEENRLKAHLRKLKEDLAPMSWRSRIEHLWTYYKWLVFAAIGAGIFLHMLLTAAIAGNREVLLSGIGINIPTSPAGVTCLTDDYLTRLEGTKRQTVQYQDEVLDFEVSGERIEAVHMLPGYTHNIINLSDTENLVTVMWANEQFDPAHPDTFFEVVE